MLASYPKWLRAAFVLLLDLAVSLSGNAQGGGNSTSITGTVIDPTGAVVPNPVVEIRNPVSVFDRTAVTDTSGRFTISKLPPPTLFSRERLARFRTGHHPQGALLACGDGTAPASSFIPSHSSFSSLHLPTILPHLKP